jgi:hypothetical protein
VLSIAWQLHLLNEPSIISLMRIYMEGEQELCIDVGKDLPIVAAQHTVACTKHQRVSLSWANHAENQRIQGSNWQAALKCRHDPEHCDQCRDVSMH